MTTQYFNPLTITDLNARSIIDDAYRAAGLHPPTVVDALSTALADEPVPYDVAVKYAHAALDNTRNIDDLVAEAVAAIQRAQAVQSFRDIYERTVDAIALERIDETRTKAVEDLKSPFGKIVRQLAKAGAVLDPRDPLNADIAFTSDTTAEYKQATAALSALSSYVITPATSTRGSHPLHRVISLITIPVVDTPEPFRVTIGGSERIPDEHAPARKRISTLDRAAHKDVDLLLLNVARGHYPDTRLELASPKELARRIQSFDNTLARVRADN